MDTISLFAGCGGLDLGFERAGFDIVWANDNSLNVAQTFRANHPNTELLIKDISKIPSADIPNGAFGLIGGPPCQSWSAAGKGLGIQDKRGRLFYEYIRVLNDKRPFFFVAENVKGMLSKTHKSSFDKIVAMIEEAGYVPSVQLLNAADYGVPQNRYRVFIVGYRQDLGIEFEFPNTTSKITVREAIADLHQVVPMSNDENVAHLGLTIPNHEYFTGSFSYIFMSRNRVLDWDSQSYTLQASGRQTAIHPQAPEMEIVETDVMKFSSGLEHLYRRLSIRECARIQTFPDDYIFHYRHLNAGYKMIGNAVPVNLAKAIGDKIMTDLENLGIDEYSPDNGGVAM